MKILLLLLSHFSRVQLCATPETAAHQAPPSLGFSRQEHCSGLPFPSPVRESEKWKWSRSVVSDSSRPMDCSPPGSSVHGIFQARVLEWGAIAYALSRWVVWMWILSQQNCYLKNWWNWKTEIDKRTIWVEDLHILLSTTDTTARTSARIQKNSTICSRK